jgi:hypothetical protein
MAPVKELDKTTIQVFTKDRIWLENLFGQPTHFAFHKVRELCPHPEKERVYTSALILAGGDSLNVLDGAKHIHGFRCGSCNRYVFSDPDVTE